MSEVQAGARPQGPPTKKRATAAGKDASLSEPKPTSKGDSLSLSPAARGPSGAALQTEVTNQDVTLGYQVTDRLKLSARYYQDSPTMLQGGALLKGEYRLGDHTTAFAGAGHLPGFYNHSIGPNLREDMAHSVVFAGIEDIRNLHRDLPYKVGLDLGLRSVAVGTLAYNNKLEAVDAWSSAGLSKATVTGEAALSRQFGDTRFSLGYGQHLDLGMIGSYYVTGGGGLPPLTHYVQAGAATKAGPMELQLDAYLPVHSATSDFSATPMARVSAGAPSLAYVPNVAVAADTSGNARVELFKSWVLKDGIDVTAMAAVNRPFGNEPEYQAGIGVRFALGGGGSKGSRARPSDDYRAGIPRKRYSGPEARVGQPHLRDFFTQDQIKAMKGNSVEELAKVLKTPEQVVAYTGDMLSYDDARLADPHGDNGSLTPNEVAALLKGVCRDQHPFMVEVMKEGAGVNGRTMGYLSPDTSHAIALYQDPKTGKWNFAEYGRVHYTNADTAEEAFERVRPDALVYSNWSDGGSNDKRHQIDIHYSATAREFYKFVIPSLNAR